MELDLGAVRAFVAIAEERHFGEAAARLGVTQQAVSKRVAKLEAHLGTTLLHRSRTGGTGLTDDGAGFLAHARALLTVADQAEEAMRHRRRPLRIDVLGTRLASTELAREFYESSAGVDIEIVTSQGLRSVRSALVDRAVDAAFARVTGAMDESIEHLPAYLEPLHAIVGHRHPLASRRRVTAGELSGYTAWMPFNRGRSEWADFYVHLEDELAIRFDTSGPNFGFEHVLERLGRERERFTFAGERTRIPWCPDVVHVAIVDPVPAYPWSLLTNRHHPHPALPLLVGYVRDRFLPLDPARQWIPAPDRAAFGVSS